MYGSISRCLLQRADVVKHQAEEADLRAQLTHVKQENAGLCGCLRDGMQPFARPLYINFHTTHVWQCICGTCGNNTRMHAGEQKFEGLQCKIAMAEVSHSHFACHDDKVA